MAQSPLQNSVDDINRRPWRETYSVHPAAEVFERLTGEELRKLADSIKRDGLDLPLLFSGDPGTGRLDQLIDGRSRLDAMQLAGLPLVQEDGRTTFPVRFLKKDEDPYDAVIRANILRRHLSEAQRRDAIAKVLALRPHLSNRQIAKVFKVDHKTVGTVRKKRESTGEISPVARTIGADGKSRPVKRNAAPGGRIDMIKASERVRANWARLSPAARGRELAGLSPEDRVALFAAVPAPLRAQWEAELAAALPAVEPTPAPALRPIPEDPELARLLVETKEIEEATQTKLAPLDPAAIGEAISDGYAGDGTWWTVGELAAAFDNADAAKVEAVLQQMTRVAYGVKADKRPRAERSGGTQYRFWHATGMKAISVAEISKKLSPIIKQLDEQGKRHMATVTISVARSAASELQLQLDQWSGEAAGKPA